MRTLITLTVLLFTLTIQAQDDACEKAEQTVKEMLSYQELNNISHDDIEPLMMQVISAVDENRDFDAVLKSMLENKTIDIKMFTATTYSFLFLKYTMICRGEYSE